jgi:hypothetical protein
LKTPLATNMCTTSFDDLPGSARTGSEDIILTDHHFWGGLRASMELSMWCRVHGRGCSMHSNNHGGISLAAMTHLGAAMPNLTYALDTHYPWQWEETIVGGRVRFDGGSRGRTRIFSAPASPSATTRSRCRRRCRAGDSRRRGGEFFSTTDHTDRHGWSVILSEAKNSAGVSTEVALRAPKWILRYAQNDKAWF